MQDQNQNTNQDIYNSPNNNQTDPTNVAPSIQQPSTVATSQNVYADSQAEVNESVQQTVQTPPQPVLEPQSGINHHPPPQKKKSKLGLILGIVIAFIILLTASTGAFAYAVAYEKVDLGNENLQRNITHAVMSLPFTPKTPRYVLESSLLAHAETTSHSFDVSASVASDGFSEFGLSSIDVKAVGDVDYSDLENINFNVTLDITNRFKAIIRKFNTKVYTKIEKLPTELLAFVGISSEKLNPVLANWIEYDITPVESEARDLLKDNVEGESYTNRIATDVIEALLDKQILSSMTMTREDYEGEDVYLLIYNPTGEEINYLYRKLDEAIDDPNTIDVDETEETDFSEIVTNLQIQLRVSSKDNLLRWASLESTIESNDDMDDLSVMVTPYLNNNQNFDLAFVLKLNNFNQKVTVEAPSSSISFEEFVTQLLEAIDPESGGLFGGLGNVDAGRQFASARDTQRRSDLYYITNAIYQFAAEHNGNLPDTDNNDATSNFPTEPTCIGTDPECFDLGSAGGDSPVSPVYIAAIPMDASIGTAGNTGYLIWVDENGRVNASAPAAEGGNEISVTR